MGEDSSHELDQKVFTLSRSEPDGEQDEEIQVANVLEGFLRSDWDHVQERSVEHTVGGTQIAIDFDNPSDPNSPYVYVTRAPGDEEREAQFGFTVTRPADGPIIFENDLRQTATKRAGYGSDVLVFLENSLQHVSNALDRDIEISFVDIDHHDVRQWLSRDNAYQPAPPKPDGKIRMAKTIAPRTNRSSIRG